MLDRPSGYRVQPSREALDPPVEREFLSLKEIGSFTRRYAHTIIGMVIAAMLAAAVYVTLAEPIYTARLQLIIDPKTAQLLREQTGELDVTFDTAQVESQIAVLRSEKIAMAIVERLDLKDDNEFQGGGAGMLAGLTRLLGLPGLRETATAIGVDGLFADEPPPMTEFERTRTAISAFEARYDVRRVGLSYVIEVQFTSNDPDKAAHIANAIGEAYISEQIEARSAAARRGGEWLEQRIAQLRTQMNTAAGLVQEFKAENRIVDTGDRRLLGEQQVSEVNTQLILARARTAEAKARLDRIEEIFRSGTPEATVVEVLGNTTITGLRVRYLDTAAREAELSTRYGADHVSAVSLRQEMQEYRRAMSDELQRIGETYKSDYRVAKAREETLDEELQKLVRDSTVTKRAQVTLSELEAAAQTYRRIYESFLQAFTESVQRQSYPVSNARVITEATKPLNKSHPRSKFIVALAGLVGGIAGFGVAIVRHGLDRSVRWPSQIRDEAGLDCLGSIPSIRTRPPKNESGEGNAVFGWLPWMAKPDAEIHAKEVADAPFSRFSDSLKAVKTSITISNNVRPVRCLGITSALPREGKSTIASNLAALFSIAGSRTVMIDADIRNSTMTRTLAPQARQGLIEVITGQLALKDAIVPAKGLDMDVLPVFSLEPVPNSNDLLGSDRMRHLLDELRGTYDIIIVDLPPLKPLVDALAVSSFLDAVVLVTQWGGTPIDMVADAANALRSANARVLGAIITKVDDRSMANYEKAGAVYYG